LKVDSEVVGSKFDPGYGNVIDLWVPSLGVQMRFAHNSRIIITSGSVPAGTSFAITGNTGRSTGPHIHFEVDSRRNRTGYKSNMVPDPYVAMIELTTAEIKGNNTASSFRRSSNQTLISSTANRTTTQKSVTPVKNPRTIPIPIPSPNNTTPQQQPVISGGGSQTVAFNSGDQLNNFVSLILLAELGNV
jgi:murein DD-endopeptidase MepM/ murein hydrolase activator NlpD